MALSAAAGCTPEDHLTVAAGNASDSRSPIDLEHEQLLYLAGMNLLTTSGADHVADELDDQLLLASAAASTRKDNLEAPPRLSFFVKDEYESANSLAASLGRLSQEATSSTGGRVSAILPDPTDNPFEGLGPYEPTARTDQPQREANETASLSLEQLLERLPQSTDANQLDPFSFTGQQQPSNVFHSGLQTQSNDRTDPHDLTSTGLDHHQQQQQSESEQHLHFNASTPLRGGGSRNISDGANSQKAVAFSTGPRERIHVLGNPVEQCPRCQSEGLSSVMWRPHRHIGELKIRYICDRNFNDLSSNHHFDIPLCPTCNQVLYLYDYNDMLGVSNARRLHKYVLKCANRHVLPLLDLFCQTKKGGERCNANFKLQWCYGTMVKRCEAQKNRDHDLWWVRYKNEWKQRRTIIRYKKDFLSHLNDTQRSLLLGLGLEGEPPPDPKVVLGPTFNALVSSTTGGGGGGGTTLHGPRSSRKRLPERQNGSLCAMSNNTMTAASESGLSAIDAFEIGVSKRRFRALDFGGRLSDFGNDHLTLTGKEDLLETLHHHHGLDSHSSSSASPMTGESKPQTPGLHFHRMSDPPHAIGSPEELSLRARHHHRSRQLLGRSGVHSSSSSSEFDSHGGGAGDHHCNSGTDSSPETNGNSSDGYTSKSRRRSADDSMMGGSPSTTTTTTAACGGDPSPASSELLPGLSLIVTGTPTWPFSNSDDRYSVAANIMGEVLQL